MGFASPGWLLLLVPIALAGVGYALAQLRRVKYAARFSNVELLSSVVPRRPGWRRHATFACLLVGLFVLAIGVAQPTASVRVPRDRATVMMAIDVSQSMMATDVAPSRLDAAKQAAKSFVDLLPAQINLGLVKFAGTASVLVSPTLDRDSVKVAIDGLSLEDSTAIGDGVYACLDSISTFGKANTAKGDQPPPARIVLLSDGANNMGHSMNQAIAAAQAAKTPVSTIAFGTDSGTVYLQGERIPVPADKAALRTLASQTGGSFHTATTESELRKVYANIGTQIGYVTVHKVDSWRYLLLGLLFTLAAAGMSLLWGGRLV
ncbi:MAG: VWA domain-containing protein [Actinomycetia bacterium]|nr:VWA domain-containing protein [Actinomycetes bacterium]